MGPHPCSAVSKILKEEGTEAWYAENSQGTAIRYSCFPYYREGATGLSLEISKPQKQDRKRIRCNEKGVGVVGTNFINSCKVSKTMGN